MLGFLSPSGEFFQCEYRGHLTLADKLLMDFYDQESNNPVDKLCRCGWVIIQSSFIGFAGDNAYHIPQLTKEQKSWLEESEDRMTHSQRVSLELCKGIDSVLYE